MITKRSTANHEEWVQLRHKYIGGSDAAAVVGMNAFVSPYALWAEKTDRLPSFEGNLATEVGTYLEEFVAQKFAEETGKKVLVTAGPTQEALDPVRYLTNHSSGKMGYAIAKMAMLRGADVTLITGPTSIDPPPFITVIPVRSAQDMFDAVISNANEADIVIKAAAVADYTPANYAEQKMKKSDNDLSLSLKRTQDILKHLGLNKRDNQVICGFSMETENMLENSKAKLEKKNLDMIVANNVKQAGAGFGTDTNIVTLITKDDSIELPVMSKDEVAEQLMNTIISKINLK